MVSNKLTVLAASAALFESALGVNPHRHLHKKDIEKRALVTDWVTEWVTVWVTAGEDAATSSAAVAAADYTTTSKAAVVSNAVNEAAKAASSKASTTTSTTVVVVPTTSSTSIANAVKEKAQTTLTTSTKAQAAAQSTTSQQVAVEEVSSSKSSKTSSKAAATTTSSSSDSSSTYSGSSGISLKRGIAYEDASLANTFESSCTNCGWAYNWGSSKGDLDDSVSFIPTLWGNKSDLISAWEDNANTAISDGSQVLFSFNEPDMAGQADLTPAEAAALHVQYMNPFKSKALIAAPSVSNSGTDGEGLSWLSEWITECESLDEACHYDYCNIHWYSAAEYNSTLFTQIEEAHSICGKPIWLTEFAPDGASDDDATKEAFLEYVIPKLEDISYLEGYSYFKVATGYLLSDSSTLSTYGEEYATAST